MPSLQMVAATDLGDAAADVVDAWAQDVVILACETHLDPRRVVVTSHRILAGNDAVHTVGTLTCAGATEWELRHVMEGTAPVTARASVVGRQARGEVDGVVACKVAVEERRLRIGGRVAHFPGLDMLAGVMSVEQILAVSAIQVVSEIAEAPLPPEARVLAGDHVRPRWEFGALTLHVQESADGVYVPFDVGSRLRAG